MNRFLILVYLVVFFSTSSFSQKKGSVEVLFDKVEKHYEEKKYYSYLSEYKFYESEKSNQFLERKEGLIVRKDNVSYQKMEESETLNFGNYTVMVNNVKKTVQVAKINAKTPVFALKTFLNIFSQRKIITNPKFWICELSADKLQVSQYQKIRFYISKKDFGLYKQVFFMKGNQEMKNNNKIIHLKDPRLEIILIENKKNTASETQLVIMSNYFSIKNKKIILSKRLKTYKLITI